MGRGELFCSVDILFQLKSSRVQHIDVWRPAFLDKNKHYLPFTNQNNLTSTVGSTEGDKKQYDQYVWPDKSFKNSIQISSYIIQKTIKPVI